MTLKLATVFSGIGAIEQALLQLGYKHEIVFASDIDKHAKTSYLANYKCGAFYDDVYEIDGRQYKEKIDLFVGGSPCQSFSILGKTTGLEDCRGQLVFEFIRLVNEIQPKCFIYENVANILTIDEGKAWETISKAFYETGYTFYIQKLNAKNYGIPQSRTRAFLVGFKTPREFSFPLPVDLTTTVRDYMFPDCLVDKKFFLSKNMSKWVFKDGKNLINTRKIDREIAVTLVASLSKGVKRTNFENYYSVANANTLSNIRRLTPRECLRLMGFSDDFKQVVSDNSLYKQAGNSIVVNVLMAIVKQIYEPQEKRQLNPIGYSDYCNMLENFELHKQNALCEQLSLF